MCFDFQIWSPFISFFILFCLIVSPSTALGACHFAFYTGFQKRWLDMLQNFNTNCSTVDGAKCSKYLRIQLCAKLLYKLTMAAALMLAAIVCAFAKCIYHPWIVWKVCPPCYAFCQFTPTKQIHTKAAKVRNFVWSIVILAFFFSSSQRCGFHFQLPPNLFISTRCRANVTQRLHAITITKYPYTKTTYERTNDNNKKKWDAKECKTLEPIMSHKCGHSSLAAI